MVLCFEIKLFAILMRQASEYQALIEAVKDLHVKVVCVTAYAELRLAWPESGKWPG